MKLRDVVRSFEDLQAREAYVRIERDSLRQRVQDLESELRDRTQVIAELRGSLEVASALSDSYRARILAAEAALRGEAAPQPRSET